MELGIEWDVIARWAVLAVAALFVAWLAWRFVRAVVSGVHQFAGSTKAILGDNYVPDHRGTWSRLVDRWDWKPFRPMFTVAAAMTFTLTVLLLERFFGLLRSVLPENMPPEAQWYIDGAIAGSLFMAALLLLATGYNAFAAVMQSLVKDDEAPPGADPDRVAQVLEFADAVHQRDNERLREAIEYARTIETVYTRAIETEDADGE